MALQLSLDTYFLLTTFLTLVLITLLYLLYSGEEPRSQPARPEPHRPAESEIEPAEQHPQQAESSSEPPELELQPAESEPEIEKVEGWERGILNLLTPLASVQEEAPHRKYPPVRQYKNIAVKQESLSPIQEEFEEREEEEEEDRTVKKNSGWKRKLKRGLRRFSRFLCPCY